MDQAVLLLFSILVSHACTFGNSAGIK